MHFWCAGPLGLWAIGMIEPTSLRTWLPTAGPSDLKHARDGARPVASCKIYSEACRLTLSHGPSYTPPLAR